MFILIIHKAKMKILLLSVVIIRLKKYIAYEPVPKELNEEQAKYILGAQANVWTEYMKNPRKSGIHDLSTTECIE